MALSLYHEKCYAAGLGFKAGILRWGRNRERERERLKKVEGEEREYQSTIEASFGGGDTGDKLVVGNVH